MNGIINVYKESGCTSQHVVSAVRKIFSTRAVGHMGTLDPQGEGVLPIGIGKGTRLFNLLLNKNKEYEAVFKFGYETDTLDKDGKIIKTTENVPSQEKIADALADFTGKMAQIPPRFSAKNINGKRAYDLARTGADFELKPSLIEVFDFKLINKVAENEYLFGICCSSGTYIRSLCRDLAANLKTYATMTAIKRTRSGIFRIEDALKIDQIAQLGEDAVMPIQQVLSDLPRIDFPHKYYKFIACGMSFPFNADNDNFTVYCDGGFFGIGTCKDGAFKLKTYLKD